MRFWHRLIRDFIIPNNAGLGDAQWRVGPTVPTCMASRYTMVMLWMPQGWDGGATAPVSRFFGLNTLTNATLEMGWVLWDGAGSVCGYVVTSSAAATSAGNASAAVENIGYFGIKGGSGYDITTFTALIGSSSAKTRLSLFGDVFIDLANSLGLSGGNADVFIKDAGASSEVSIPRGRRWFASSTANSGAFGAALTNVLTVGDQVGRANRAYCAMIGSRYSTAAGQQLGAVLVYGAGATQIVGWDWFTAQVGANPVHMHARQIFRIGSADVSFTNVRVQMLSTAAAGANWLGSAAVPRYCEVVDIGAASDYPSMPQF